MPDLRAVAPSARVWLPVASSLAPVERALMPFTYSSAAVLTSVMRVSRVARASVSGVVSMSVSSLILAISSSRVAFFSSRSSGMRDLTFSTTVSSTLSILASPAESSAAPAERA